MAVVQRVMRLLEERVRSHKSGFPFGPSKLLIVFCVLFCAQAINRQMRRTSVARMSPLEAYCGRKLNAAIDLRAGFGDYVIATAPYTDNLMKPRVGGCIALLPTRNITGSVKLLNLRTGHVGTRDRFKVAPIPSDIVDILNVQAAKDGYAKRADQLC